MGSLSCLNNGDVPHWDSALGWYCDGDVDTTLSEKDMVIEEVTITKKAGMDEETMDTS